MYLPGGRFSEQRPAGLALAKGGAHAQSSLAWERNHLCVLAGWGGEVGCQFVRAPPVFSPGRWGGGPSCTVVLMSSRRRLQLKSLLEMCRVWKRGSDKCSSFQPPGSGLVCHKGSLRVGKEPWWSPPTPPPPPLLLRFISQA